jgi:outer membrane protein TolC
MKSKSIHNQGKVKSGRLALAILFTINFLSSSVFSQTLTLDSILARIEMNNPALLSYTNKISSADELANGARALPAPKAGIMFDENPYEFGFGPKAIDLSVSQTFPNTKALNAKEDYLKSISDIELKEGEQLKNKFFAQAKIKYFERYITERRITVLKENIGLMKSMIEISEKQMASGMSDLGSIYKMKARLADTETMLLHEENMVKSLTVELNYLMAVDINQTFSIDTNNLLKDYRSQSILGAKDLLESSRSDIQKMNSEITSMKLNQRLTSMMSKPEFEVSARHMARIGKPDMFALEAMVMIPIAPWSSKGYKSEVKSMGFRIDAMQQDKQAMINMASQMVSMLLIEFNTEYAEVENYSRRVIPSYKKSFETNLLAYSQNTGDLMQAILAWDDLQMAQMKYIEHFGTLLKTQAEYEREMQIR